MLAVRNPERCFRGQYISELFSQSNRKVFDYGSKITYTGFHGYDTVNNFRRTWTDIKEKGKKELEVNVAMKPVNARVDSIRSTL